MSNRKIANITHLVTHHGADSRKLTLAEAKRIYQDTHHEALYKRYKQPRSTHPECPDVAYHAIIGTNGWDLIRPIDTYGYHAGNYPVNLASVAIVITGNYERDTLSPGMEHWYREAVSYFKQECPNLRECGGHRTFAKSICPGRNTTDEFIKSIFTDPLPQPREAVLNDILNATKDMSEAVKDLQKAVTKLS